MQRATTPQDLMLGLRAGRVPDAALIIMVLMSQAPSLRSLCMRHDAIPADHLGALASLQSLTSLVVRHGGLPYVNPGRLG